MIKIICLGKIKEEYLKELISDYQKRINKYHPLTLIELKDENNLKKEEEAILKQIGDKDYVITLEIAGKSLDSLTFAKVIDEAFIHYSTITFVIGSSLGLSEKVKSRGDLKLSFSKLTFPHGLFRGILLEQIYRVFKINNHEQYHK